MALNSNIVIFLSFSVLLHAGLGQLLYNNSPSRTPGSAITLSLLPPDSRDSSSPSSMQSAGGKSVLRASGQPLQQNVDLDLVFEADRQNPSAKVNLADQPDNVALATKGKPDSGTSQESRIQASITGTKLKRILQNNMAQFFHYPEFALRRGWQGEVTIGIRIEPDGYISRTQLVNSSGYSTLDLAALKGARKLKSLPNAVTLLHGHAFDLELPVIYRLLDG